MAESASTTAVTTGVVGGRWRADVTPGGSIVPWDGTAPLAWHVAADDRWHDPATDAGVRQTRVAGSAVVETRVRIPSGDAVQRVWSVADAGGLTIVEVRNESPLPIACAFTRSDVLTARPPADVPIEGIDLPGGSFVMPVGHRAGIAIALAHTAPARGPLPAGLPDSEAVARGWAVRTDSASRLELPDPALAEVVRAARCEVMLAGLVSARDDAARFLLGAAELVRMAELDAGACADLSPEVAEAVTVVGGRDRTEPWLVAAALDAAGVVLAAAGEDRALADLARLARRFPAGATPPDASSLPSGDVAIVTAVERRLAAGPVLFPDGIPSGWMGQAIEAHGLVAAPATRLSLALRWHGPNAAILWECTGDPVTLTRGGQPPAPWLTTAASGEALWSF